MSAYTIIYVKTVNEEKEVLNFKYWNLPNKRVI